MSDLEYQAATLAAREWGIVIAAGHLAIAAIVGGVQCVLIWRGLDFMRRAADARDRGLENQRLDANQRHENQRLEANQRHESQRLEADQRHAENMAALKALIEGQADTKAGIDAQSAALAEAVAALKVVVERTTPAPGGAQ